MSLKTTGQLFRENRFWPLFVLIQTGTFNDNSLKNALIGLVTFGGLVFLPALPTASHVPIAAFIFTAPFLLGCAIAGQIADKYDRGHVLQNVKRVEIAIMFLAFIGFWTLNVWILSFCLFCMGAQSAFFSPTKNAVLPQWLHDKELIAGNGLLNGFAFVFILVGMIGGLFLISIDHGVRWLATILCISAIIGWWAAEQTPKAPPANPQLKINFEPITATGQVLKQSIRQPHVLRPMLGIAWFYSISTILLTSLPDYVKSIMGYNVNVLIVLLLIATFGILFGCMLCTVLAKSTFWGSAEALGLSCMGIIGIILSVSGFYFYLPSESVAEKGQLQGLDFFLTTPHALHILISLGLSAIFSGLFVVPLQAMAQRRALPRIRASLMAAGAILLNLAVNLITLLLIGLSTLKISAKAPFLLIIIVSCFIAIYCIWRLKYPQNYTNYAVLSDG